MRSRVEKSRGDQVESRVGSRVGSRMTSRIGRSSEAKGG